MKKFTAIIVSILILALFVLSAWWLYRNFYSTPMLILNLLIILTGVLLSITVYLRLAGGEENQIFIEEEEYPNLENGLIYVQVSDFVSKYEKNKGSLYIIGIDIKEDTFKLEKATFKKLTDELKLEFSPSLVITLTGVSTIAVGESQFMIHGFEIGKVKYDRNYNFDWKHDKLLLKLKGKKAIQLRLPAQMPTMVFTWGDHNNLLEEL